MKWPRRTGRGRERRAQRLLERAEQGLAKVPSPSPNPATNLLIGDIAMRGVNLLAGRVIEKALLKLRYRGAKADQIVEGRSFAKSLAATGAARVATKSVPGLLAVSGGLVAKSIYDRSLGPRKAKRKGDDSLEQMADNAKDD